MADWKKQQAEPEPAKMGSASPLDPFSQQRAMEKMREEQNLVMGFIGGLVAAVIAAAIWAGVTIVTQYQISWMAIGVGFVVGFAVRTLGKGVDWTFGVMGAGLSLLACLLGNLAFAANLAAQEFELPIMEVVTILFQQPEAVIELMTATFAPMDLLFYGLALFFGFRASINEAAKV